MNDELSSNEGQKPVRSTRNAAARAASAVDSARSKAHGTVDIVADQANAAIDWTAARFSAAADTPNRYLDAGAGYIRQRPFVAVGIALAVGYLVGRLRS